MEGAKVVKLTGDEAVVYFSPEQAFTGVSEEWLRPRLRLDPAVESLGEEYIPLLVELDGELIEDLDLDTVLGSGPNDGTLVVLEDDQGNGVQASVHGGWLETIFVEVRHDVRWIGFKPDLRGIVRDWAIDFMTTYDQWYVTFDRVGAWDDLLSSEPDPDPEQGL